MLGAADHRSDNAVQDRHFFGAIETIDLKATPGGTHRARWHIGTAARDAILTIVGMHMTLRVRMPTLVPLRTFVVVLFFGRHRCLLSRVG
jgi:hypothetical protein